MSSVKLELKGIKLTMKSSSDYINNLNRIINCLKYIKLNTPFKNYHDF